MTIQGELKMASSNQGNQGNQGGSKDQSQGNQSGQSGGKEQGGTSNRGFASMDPDKQREIASKGGKAAHESGNAHEFSSEEAREAGRKGGQSSGGSNQGGQGGQGGNR
jgi:general stress protein YciG